MTIDTIVGLVAGLLGCLSLIVFNMVRGEIRMVRGDTRGLSDKIEGLYTWADRRFVEKDVCRERHEALK